jgi:hypothetical protein
MIDSAKLDRLADGVAGIAARFDALTARHDETRKYTVQAAEEWGIGTGPNGTGKRRKVKGFYVVSPRGRKIQAFSINSVKTEEIQRKAAQQWADEMTGALERGERWADQ